MTCFKKTFFLEIRNSALHRSHFTISSLPLSTSLRGFIILNYWIIYGHKPQHQISSLQALLVLLFDLELFVLVQEALFCPHLLVTVLSCCTVLVWKVGISSNGCSSNIFSFFLSFLLGPHVFLLFAVSQPKVNIGSYPKDQQGLGRACGSACDDHQCLTSRWAGRDTYVLQSFSPSPGDGRNMLLTPWSGQAMD